MMGTPWNPSVEGLNHSGVFVCSFGLQRLRRIFSIFEIPPKKFTGKNGSFLLFGPLEKNHPVLFFGRLKPGGFVFHGWPHPNCVDQQRLGKIASAMSALGIPGFHPWKVLQFSQGVEGNNERANLGGWEPGLFQVYILRP